MNWQTIPLIVTSVTSVKLVPVIWIGSIGLPLSGLKPTIVGGGRIVKFVEEVTLPQGVVITSRPVVAPAGIWTTTVEAVFVCNERVEPFSVTELDSSRLVPEIVTTPLATVVAGVKLEIVGGNFNVKAVELVEDPTGLEIVILSDVKPDGTVIDIKVVDETLYVAETEPK